MPLVVRQRTALPGEPNYGFVDRYTPAHMLWGVFLGLSGMSWPLALGLSIAWEVLEHPLKDHLPEMFPNATQDTWMNSVGDIGANMIGYTLGHKLGLVRGAAMALKGMR
jgi:hypothetical protein